jgi:hypothetical protein
MPKADKKPKVKILTPRENGYMLMPWSCNHYPTYSEVVAYVPITGEWEIVADIHNARGLDAEILAGLITRAVNSFENSHDMIAQMTAALELCLECDDCLTWEAEHEAQSILNRIKRTG